MEFLVHENLLLHVLIVLLCVGFCEPTDQACNGGLKNPVECYECVSYGHSMNFCSDPFNRTHTALKTAICHGACVKWVKKSKNGVTRYVRTCSSQLHLRISIALVCMRESPPEEGHLCFCHRDRCNTMAPSIHELSPGVTIVLFVSLLTSSLLIRFNTKNHATSSARLAANSDLAIADKRSCFSESKDSSNEENSRLRQTIVEDYSKIDSSRHTATISDETRTQRFRRFNNSSDRAVFSSNNSRTTNPSRLTHDYREFEHLKYNSCDPVKLR